MITIFYVFPPENEIGEKDPGKEVVHDCESPLWISVDCESPFAKSAIHLFIKPPIPLLFLGV